MRADNDNELPRTRAEAKAKGLKRYFTGKPCKHGHVDVRSTHTGRCFECDRMKKRIEREGNPERVRERKRANRLANIEGNRAKERERSRRRYAENPEFYRAYNKSWREANAEAERERGREKHRKAKEENPERIREAGRRRDEKRRATPKGRLENSISAGMHRGITKGSKASRRTFDLLGYTVEELMGHLEAKFQPGMSWENYGKGGWHIDHKIPLSAHNYNSPDDLDFKRAWALENLQPLWERDNMVKGASLVTPFQPSLSFFAETIEAANDNEKEDEEAV